MIMEDTGHTPTPPLTKELQKERPQLLYASPVLVERELCNVSTGYCPDCLIEYQGVPCEIVAGVLPEDHPCVETDQRTLVARDVEAVEVSAYSSERFAPDIHSGPLAERDCKILKVHRLRQFKVHVSATEREQTNHEAAQTPTEYVKSAFGTATATCSRDHQGTG